MVKVLSMPVAADPETLARFEREPSSARGQADPSTCKSAVSRAIWRLQETSRRWRDGGVSRNIGGERWLQARRGSRPPKASPRQ
jgi:hypothetical protein